MVNNIITIGYEGRPQGLPEFVARPWLAKTTQDLGLGCYKYDVECLVNNINTTVYITVDTTVDCLSLNHLLKDTTITTDTTDTTAT